MQINDGYSKSGKRNCPEHVAWILNGRVTKDFVTQYILQAPSQQAADAALDEYRSTLKGLVDAWLDSGKTNGVDCPWERIMPYSALCEFFERNPPKLIPIDLRYLTFQVEPTFARSTDPVAFAHDRAIVQFIQLMDSPTKAKLSRCDKCPKYFVRGRSAKRDAPIKNGTYCEAHRGLSRGRSMKGIRADHIEKLEKLAIQLCVKWERRRPRAEKSLSLNTEKSEWIADQMRTELRLWIDDEQFKWVAEYLKLTKKWVRQHRKAIEEGVERREHAKG
jgi:hypothetical protein